MALDTRIGGRRTASWGSVVVLVLAWMASLALGFDTDICSELNTGASHFALQSKYMSAGKCHDSCGGYAFAIVQGQNCYCSNYAPSSSVSTSSCNENCDGYPYEKCGNSDDGLFSYLKRGTPSGTTGAGGSVQTTERSSASVTRLAPVTISSSIALSDAANPSSLDNSGSAITTYLPTPVTQVTTIQGGVKTVVVTPSNPPYPLESNGVVINSSNRDPFWDNKGKVAGTFTVVALIIVGIIAAVLFYIWRRSRQNDKAMTVGSNDDDHPTSSNGAPYMVDRRRSNLTLATAGLAGLTRGSSREKSPVDKTPGSMSRRGSIPMVHDQRLNPAALWQTQHMNGSHTSVASFRDDQDYSRPVLHVRNPDMD